MTVSADDAQLIRTLREAEIIDLEHPRRAGDPTFRAHAPGTILTLHRRHETGLGEIRTSASAMLVTTEHAGTHIDALCHQAAGMMMHGGVEVTSETQTAAGFTALGAETIPPIIRPGVLLDVASVRMPAAGELLTAADLQAAWRPTGLQIQPGDVVLVRTGWGSFWTDPDRYLAAPGIAADASRWLAAHSVYAVGIDNVAWDLPGYVDPDMQCTLPGHLVLIVESGIYIIENLALEALAAANPGRFAFVCLPLKFVGGTGCPVRPIALVAGTRRGAT